MDNNFSKHMRYDEKAFIINGQRYFLTSGSVHYFRIPKELWWDRLTKAKQGGLNTIQTYVPWNYHEHREGQFDFEGERDLSAFLRLCQELELFVILRPGPYICAEWEYGGFPVWFLEKQDLIPRHHSPVYLRYVKRWFDVLLPKVREHLITMGGPIIMVQIENELGNLIPDTESKPYMAALQQMCITNGIDVPLITCAGGLEGTLECINSHDPVDSFEQFRTKDPHAPLFSTEFWTQWYDVWGGPRPATKTTEQLLSRTWNILAQGGAGYNYYMWHGGTNFGYSTSYLQTTSYDYDAPLSETGRFTPKYHKTREIALYATVFSDILTTAYTGDAEDYVSWKDKELEISVRRSDTGSLLFVHNTGAVPVNATMQQKKHGLEFPLELEPDEVWPLAFDSQLVAGVSDANLHLEFTTAKVLTHVENNTHSYLVLYGKGGTRGTTVFSGKWKSISDNILSQKDLLVLNHAYDDNSYQIFDIFLQNGRVLTVISLSEKMMQRTWAVGQNLVIGADFAAIDENNGLLVESRKEYELWDDAGRHHRPATLSDPPALPVLTDWQWANGAPESASDYIERQWINMKQPTEMTRLGHYGAYGWYRCRFSYKPGRYVLYLSEFADRALIFLNDELVTVTGHPPENRIMHPALTVELHLTQKDNVLAILVDNLGRIRHDCQLSNSMDNEAKGLFGKVVLDWALELTDWRFRGGLSFENEDSVFHPQTQKMGAAFRRTFFDLSPAHLEASDPIILCTEGLSKGVIWLNGHNLGRFWEIGPIHRNYVPIPWLKLHNELVIFDEMGNSIDAVRLAYDR